MNLRIVPRLALLLGVLASAPLQAAEIAWKPWSPAAFTQAGQQHRIVFLYLEATWCHWCHVMQQETLRDAKVQKVLKEHFVALRVDHDANPMLANRFRDYGWPALIFFAADGTELVKRAGYIAPEEFAQLLAAIVADPTPEKAAPPAAVAAGASALPAAARATLLREFEETADDTLGGLRTAQKFIDRDSVEYALVHAGDAKLRQRAERTLSAAQALIDPVWGGAFQYSTGGDWDHPHHEKIMRTQAGVLRSYALAYGALHRDEDLRGARAVRDYLLAFLRGPQGAFFVSQDADLADGRKADGYYGLDDAARRRRGMPRIDRSLYADANGQAAEALALLAEVSGDDQAQDAAIRAGEWIWQKRRRAGGGFAHGDHAKGPAFLADTLYPARAFIALYRQTAQRQWLERATLAGEDLGRLFKSPDGGFVTAQPDGSPLPPTVLVEENIPATRLLNLLRHYSGRTQFQELAQHGMRFLSRADVIDATFTEPGILLADEELGADPPHLTVVGARGDAAAQALWTTALRTAPRAYRRVEWLDPAQGPLPNSDVQYPKLPRAAAFVCVNRRCSRPSFEPADYAAQIVALSRPAS